MPSSNSAAKASKSASVPAMGVPIEMVARPLLEDGLAYRPLGVRQLPPPVGSSLAQATGMAPRTGNRARVAPLTGGGSGGTAADGEATVWCNLEGASPRAEVRSAHRQAPPLVRPRPTPLPGTNAKTW